MKLASRCLVLSPQEPKGPKGPVPYPQAPRVRFLISGPWLSAGVGLLRVAHDEDGDRGSVLSVPSVPGPPRKPASRREAWAKNHGARLDYRTVCPVAYYDNPLLLKGLQHMSFAKRHTAVSSCSMWAEIGPLSAAAAPVRIGTGAKGGA